MADVEESREDECEVDSGLVRRPMNAFLIFCKRHRSLVREKYPHMENRSITKILGEWWANLEVNEKSIYVDLAKQYKEAFMKANPDFRWYKVPTPTSRTLVTRPSNQRSTKMDVTTRIPATNKCSLTPGKLADETQLGGLNSLITPTPPSSVLLSKPPKKRYLHNGALLTRDSFYSSNSDPQTSNACSALLELASLCSAKVNTDKKDSSNSNCQKEGESDGLKDDMNKEREAKVSQQQLINCIIENTIGAAQDSSRLNGSVRTNHLFASTREKDVKKESDIIDDEEEDKQSKEERDCGCRKSERKGKGSRYQALLSEGILQPPKDRRSGTHCPRRTNMNEVTEGKTIKTRKRMSSGANKAENIETNSMNLEDQIAALPRCSFEALVKKKKKSCSESGFVNSDDRFHSDTDPAKDPDFKPSKVKRKPIRRQSDPDSSNTCDENDCKPRFQTGDFDLEKQIAALPSLNIELLNQRKKQHRNKVAANNGGSRNINKNKNERNSSIDRSSTSQSSGLGLVGSQKRKARKRSITHLDPSAKHKPHTSVFEANVLDTLSQQHQMTEQLK